MRRDTSQLFQSSGAPERSNLSSLIIDKITGLLAAGLLKPGDRLPSIEELSRQFSVGRTSVREALRALELVGVVEIRHGEGTFIGEDVSRFCLKPLSWGALLDQDRVSELAETRRCIEGELAGLAAKRATPEDIAEIEKALLRMEVSQAGGGNVDEYAAADMELHFAIGKAARNEVMFSMLTSITDLLRRTISEVVKIPGTIEAGLLAHRAVFEAIAAHDPEEARSGMRRHLDYVERSVLSALAASGTAPWAGSSQEG
ncbi:MAG TPA: FadR/GntR family transcriptional regulator [Chloroflexota bacterium]|nr:FadR/GntR family transcriptional regulator [Chloroflexota bacterium]